MTDEQRAYMHARDKFSRFVIGPAKELLDATATLVNLATQRAEETQQVMNQLRPVWAQGWTSDSEAAQASANALSELWQMLAADNQTDAVETLRALKERDYKRLAGQ